MIGEIIFDLDGTLWDCRVQAAKSWNIAINKYSDCGVTVAKETFDNLMGLTNEVIMEKIFPMLTKEERNKLEVCCCEELHELLLEEPGRLYEGVPEMLEKLAAEHRLFIVSNSQAGYIETFLKTTDLSKYITGTLCFGDTKRPKGENICQVIKEYNLKNPVYVGDMKADGEAAHYAKIPIVYVTYGFGTIPDADYIVDTPEGLVELIAEKG